MNHKTLLVLVSIVFTAFACQSASTPTLTNQDASTRTPEVATQTPEPTLQQVTLQPTDTNLSPEIVDAYSIPMALVPEGEFTMGSFASDAVTECIKNGGEFCKLSYFTNADPPHKVYLDLFYIDIYEVTNTAYKACVEAGNCTSPNEQSFIYYGNSEFDAYPVIYVDWNQAKTYCAWRGGNLPTEAQWEKAARGTDNRTYPWGEDISCNQANYYSEPGICIGERTKVGSYESDKSPYGIYDLGGNVFEWTADWYSSTYYENPPAENPLGPETGTFRVVRGGAWNSVGYYARVSSRSLFQKPDEFDNATGFRCVKYAIP